MDPSRIKRGDRGLSALEALHIPLTMCTPRSWGASGARSATVSRPGTYTWSVREKVQRKRWKPVSNICQLSQGRRSILVLWGLGGQSLGQCGQA